jgi:hypothetical protein
VWFFYIYIYTKTVAIPNLYIDESILPFKGRLAFKLSATPHPTHKKHHCSIKLFVLCDAGSGYLLDFIINSGKGTELTDTLNLGS